MSPSLTRRVLLGTGVAIAAGAGLTGLPQAHAQTELDAMRQRWAEALTGGVFDETDPVFAARLETIDATVQGLLDTMAPAADRVWPDLPLGPALAANASETLTRVGTIATAWAGHGTAIAGDPAVAAALADAHRIVLERGYHAGMTVQGNWWFWEIGTPGRVATSLTLLYDVVPAEVRTGLLAAVRRFTPDPNYRGTAKTLSETGANRVDKALACALRGILDDRPDEIELARDALSDTVGGGRNSLFTYVTSGDGFYRDGSFVQHSWLPYIGTYGNVALGGLARMFSLLGGTAYDVTDPAKTVILDAPAKSYATQMWQGQMLEVVRGRAVSRQKDTGALNGFAIADALFRMATTQPEPYRTQFTALALGWLERSPGDYDATASLPNLILAQQARAGAVEPAPEPTGHQVFASQERVVHRRPGWAFTVALSSSRIGRYEWGNRENNHGWYQGDGAAYLMLENDKTQTSDDYWPTVDPYRLPGTTVDRRTRSSGEADGTGIPRAFQPWGGGVEVLGRYGAQGMDHLNHDKTLRGKLSWFCLDDMVVALGAGITTSTTARVESTIENRNLHADGENMLTVDGVVVGSDRGSEATVTRPRWAHLDGVGGYLLTDVGRLLAGRAERSGTWRAINSGADTGGDETVRTRRYASLVVDHGAGVTGGRYAYAIVPGAGAARTAALAATPPYTVDDNTETLQAITARAGTIRLTLANAFAAADGRRITTTGPCSVAVAQESRTVTVAVSDPSRTATSVTVTLPTLRGVVSRVESMDDTVEVLSMNPLTVRVAVVGSGGQPHRVTLTR